MAQIGIAVVLGGFLVTGVVVGLLLAGIVGTADHATHRRDGGAEDGRRIQRRLSSALEAAEDSLTFDRRRVRRHDGQHSGWGTGIFIISVNIVVVIGRFRRRRDRRRLWVRLASG
ncbi:hypothetical protein [Mycolicibacterium llatzerense]|uniref:hypothetical protein n=1 Tax=Mycolicibacterium llatzerense TaxID=280871 RepID=UPI0019551790|nr:hypothetical protein [Mycolicibacterium llatzerense]